MTLHLRLQVWILAKWAIATRVQINAPALKFFLESIKLKMKCAKWETPEFCEKPENSKWDGLSDNWASVSRSN